MSRTRRWRTVALVAATILSVPACSASPAEDAVQTGAGSRTGSGSGSTGATAAHAAGSASSAVSTSAAAQRAGASGSAVAGLSLSELRSVVGAAPSARGRRAEGPLAERVALADGRSAWRVRVPGRFAPRSARLLVAVGGVEIGPGFEAPGLDALIAVTLDPGSLIDGAEVSWRSPGDDPVPAGMLQVIR